MFENIIADLLSVSGVRGVFISSIDGSLVESETTTNLDEISCEMHAALIAEIFNNSAGIISKLSDDCAEFILIDGGKNRIIVSKAGELLLLGLITDHSANYGLLKIEIKKAVEKIAAMI